MNRTRYAPAAFKRHPFFVALLFAGLIVPLAAPAQTTLPSGETAESSVMRGSPPPDDRLVTRANALHYPYLRWALRNTRMLNATANVEHASSPLPLPADRALDPDAVQVTIDGTTLTLTDYLRRTYTDGFIVVHDGRIVFERYFDGYGKNQTHAWASMTKSVTGLLAARLIEEGKLDPDTQLSTYVPELEGTPFGDATLQQNLDMEVPVSYPADLPPDLGLFAAVGLVPRRAGAPDSIYGFLKVAQTEPGKAAGKVWYYQNGSPEAVAWAIRRVTGESWSKLVSRMIWGNIAGNDADVVVDRAGTEMASGGLNTTLRDAARLGEMVRRGTENQSIAFPSAAIRRALKPTPNAAAFAQGNLAQGRPGYGYHDYWYQLNDGDGSFAAGGRFGQAILVNPRARLTIVKFSAAPDQAARPVSAEGGVVDHGYAPLETADALHRVMLGIAAKLDSRSVR
jgi:CubicO group peptidase (beta-lactamase class C family)